MQPFFQIFFTIQTIQKFAQKLKNQQKTKLMESAKFIYMANGR